MEALKDVKETTTVELGALLDAGDGAVVTLVAGDTRLVAHRAVLASRSPVFMAMFGHDTLEASSGQVVIPDIEGPVLRQLLAYLYTLQAPQLSGTAPQLLAAADKYGLLALKAHCEQQLVAQLAVENAAAAAVLAVRHSCSSLRQAALAFIKAHGFQVMATQGWADAVREQPEDLIEVSQMLHDPTPETRAPAVTGDTTAASTSTSAAASASASDSASASASGSASTSASASGATTAATPHQPQRRSPAAAVPPSPLPDAAAVSRIRAPAAARGTTAASTSTSTAASTSASVPAATAAAAPRQPQRRTPAAVTPSTPPPDAAAVSRLRSLSAEERNRRLREAAQKGAVGELRALLAAGADVGAGERGSKGTALHIAAQDGRVKAVRCLLEAGAQVGARDSGQNTPLHLAAYWGHTAVVRLLLASSADPNARDHEGRTPLHDTASCGHAEAAAALLEAGANRCATDNRGKTPLDLARQRNEQQVIQLLS